ncbi:hypothetical protein LUX12_18040 [Streptomyces somaliensis]|uniref:hypothetical protein n=1 Tax=Streptomyces somaliensis TaxID=78355 RepID=UPI0020CF3DD3|nr:hypothetical protein [Streptomyces somaliensis]MCP9946269.1 hypothetical protein [Streptomyces somaliensis]
MQTTPPAASLRPGATDRVARAAAIAACLPYLALKAAWLAGGRVGIPEGSVLLEQPRLMAVANTVTLLMDTAVIVLALLLTQRWGERVPAWLPAFPAWVATGLLLPIAVGFPLNALAGLLGGGRPAAGPSEPFLDAWVFTVVYGGFTVQGLALGTLFVRYAGRRWSPLWRGAVRDLPPRVAGPRVRAAAVAASLALVPGTAAHLGWAAGMTEGLPPSQAAARTAGFHVLEAAQVLYAAAAAAGTGLLVFRRGRGLPVRLPLVLGWAGSAVLGCWGGWRFLAAMTPVADPSSGWPAALPVLTYAGDVIAGTVLAGCVAAVLRGRAG